MKSYVIDTNVILYDPESIHAFSDSKVIIPLTVLKEIDTFKNGTETNNFNARSFIRDVDKNNYEWLILDGYEVPEDYTNDEKILHVAKLSGSILVTKDISLRTIAKASSVEVQDYENENLTQPSKLYKGYRTVRGLTKGVIDTIYSEGFLDKIEQVKDPVPNEYFTLKAGKQSALCQYSKEEDKYLLIQSQSVFGITPRNAEQIFALDALTDPNIPLVTMTGKAGTGKTLIALVAALSLKKEYRKILVARPTVDLGKGIGFLPGDINDKVAPYLQPIFDNLDVIASVQPNNGKTGKEKIKELMDSDKIQIEALNFIRGRSLPKVFFIIDEAQNLSPHEIKTIVTRAGEETKIVLIGDIEQVDTPYLDSKSNGLNYLINVMRNESISAHIHLKDGQRSELAEVASNKL